MKKKIPTLGILFGDNALASRIRDESGLLWSASGLTQSKYSSSSNLVHDSNKGKGGGKFLLGLFSLKEILLLLKGLLTETDKPDTSIQSSHAVGNCCVNVGVVEKNHELRVMSTPSDAAAVP